MTIQEIVELFEQLELHLINSLKRNLMRHRRQEQDEGGKDGVPENWEAWQSAKLRDVRRFRRENEKILGEYMPTIEEETEKLLREQYAEGGVDSFFGSSDPKLESLIHEIQNNEVRVEQGCLRYMSDVYRKTILRTATAVNAGGMSMHKAVDEATADFLAQGINCIRYSNGRLVNIASYAEMALRTCNTRAMLMGEAKQRERLGIDTVLVSQYGACSDTCLPWQGRVYIDDVFQTYNGPRTGSFGISRNGKQYMFLSVAIKGGLFHPNCRHTITTWIEGVSTMPQPMDVKEIERINKLEKTQRALERMVRQSKREVEGLTDPDAIKGAKRILRARQAQLRQFVEKNGDVLRRDYWRERYDYTSPQNNPHLYNANDYAQYERYLSRLGDRMPENGYVGFLEMKRSNSSDWMKIQEDYRYTGIVNRLLKACPDAVVCENPDDIPDEYHDAAQSLSAYHKDGLYHYSHYKEGVRMNQWLGGVPGVNLSEQEIANLQNTSDALQHMSLPHNTILWRGTEPKLLKGFEQLDQTDLQSWKNRPLYMDGFTSTSILKSASYNTKPIQMVILAPGGTAGAGYIDDVSYNAAHLGSREGKWTLQREYEILLQKGARFDIIEAQKFNDRTIVVVRWVPDGKQN